MIEKLLRKKFVAALCITGRCSSRVSHSSLRSKDFNHFLQQLYRLLFFKHHNGKIFHRLFFIISRKQRSGSVTIHNDLTLVCLTLFFSAFIEGKRETYPKHDKPVSPIWRWILKRVNGTSNTTKLTIYETKGRKFRFLVFSSEIALPLLSSFLEFYENPSWTFDSYLKRH